jgi:hypothetical protein
MAVGCEAQMKHVNMGATYTFLVLNSVLRIIVFLLCKIKLNVRIIYIYQKRTQIIQN